MEKKGKRSEMGKNESVLQRVRSSGKSGLRFQNPDLRFAIYYEIHQPILRPKTPS